VVEQTDVEFRLEGDVTLHLSVSREGTGYRLAVAEVAVPTSVAGVVPTSVAAGVGPKPPGRAGLVAGPRAPRPRCPRQCRSRQSPYRRITP
jgi:hypothetical protein